MSAAHSDALAFFGVTGDLAYKKIFPLLQAMLKRGRTVRSACRETDAFKRQAALEALAKSAKIAELPARALARLAGGLDPLQAVELLRRAQRKYPADFWVNHHLGLVLLAVTPPEREEAVRFLTAAVALRPESPGAHYNLGLALAGKGQVDEAIACYKKAIELDPKDTSAHINLGLALYDKGRLDEAIACFNKAIALDPKYALAYNNLADILANAADPKLRDPVQAVAEAKKAIELDPKLGIAWNTLGVAYYRTCQWQEAITALDKGLALLQGGTSEDFFFLAMAHHRAGHKDEAKKWYDKGIAWMGKHAPKDPALLRYRSEAASVLGVK
jgi:superkiller protein 3